MKRVSKLLKIRFFLLLIFILAGFVIFLGRLPKNTYKISFDDEMIPRANYNEINLQRIGYYDDFATKNRQIKDISLATTNYLIFTDAYISSIELKKLSKIYTKSTIHKTNEGEKVLFFLESPLLTSQEDLTEFEAALTSKNITYKVMKVVG